MGADGEVSAPVSRRMELQVRTPVDILLDFAAHRTVGEVSGLTDRRIPARKEIARLELGVGVQIESHAGIDRAHHAVAVPRLRLHEQAVGDHALVERVARFERIDVPVLVVIERLGHELARLVAVAPFVDVGLVAVGIDLAPRAVLERMAHHHRREVGQREILLRDALQRNGVGLRDEEAVVAVEVLRLCVGQLHRNARRHLERRVGDGPLPHHAAVLLLLDVVVVEPRMHRVALARVAHGNRKVVVLGARPDILSPRAARLVVDVETRGGRDVLRHHDAEILLAVAFLSRLEVVHADERPLRVVEGHVLHVVSIGVVGIGEDEVGRLGPQEVVERQRGLTKGSLRDIAHALAHEGVVDAEIGERRVERFDLHAVVVLVDVPPEVGQRADRIVEKVGFERFADAPLLLGRVGRLPLRLFVVRVVGIDVVVGTRLPPLLGTHQAPGVEPLRTHRARHCEQQRKERHEPAIFHPRRHKP